MLMTRALAEQIVAMSKSPLVSASYDAKRDIHMPLVGLEFAHFVKVNELSITSTSEGKNRTYLNGHVGETLRADIPYDDFLQGYRGIISAQPVVRRAETSI